MDLQLAGYRLNFLRGHRPSFYFSIFKIKH